MQNWGFEMKMEKTNEMFCTMEKCIHLFIATIHFLSKSWLDFSNKVIEGPWNYD